MIGTPSVMKNNRSALGHSTCSSNSDKYVRRWNDSLSWNKIFTKNVEFRTGKREHAFIRNV